MSAFLQGRFQVVLLALCAAFSVAACGEGEVPEAMTLKAFHGLSPGKDGCVHADLPSTQGLFDVRKSSSGYGDFYVYLQLQNNLKSNEDLGVGRLDTNWVKVESYELRYDRSGPWAFLPESHTIETGTVIETSEKYYAPIVAIPQGIARLINERTDLFEMGPVELRISVRAKGKLFDGSSAVSNDLGYTVAICRDCFLPCGGGSIEAMCAAGAQPDAYKCGGSSGGESGGGDGGAGRGGEEG